MSDTPNFRAFFATTDAHLAAAQRLRHDVFVRELGAIPTDASKEMDRFDEHADHLLLVDEARSENDRVVGVYRLMDEGQAKRAGGFSSANEYDLRPLVSSDRRILELGRSCVHLDYRGGLAIMHLWQALAEHIRSNDFEILFGVASFHGAEANEHAESLTLLHQNHLAPMHLRPSSKDPAEFNCASPDALDRRKAMANMPSLIKAYLRLGGTIGDGAFEDKAFNTTDVCMIVDVAEMDDRQRSLYAKAPR